jgi:adenine-specific DNA methylase
MKNTLELHKRWKDDPSNGEVFTPIELVHEMLDKIPIHVWKNSNSTFLDPCMGKGTFLVEIVNRLVYIYGYSKEDAISRVYGYDIRVKYVNYLKRGGFINIFHKDSLNEKFNMSFDVILGNPPYQENSVSGKSKGGGKGGDKNLYSKFIAKSNEIVKDGGLIMFLTPPSIFSPKNKNKDILLDSKNNLKLVRLFNENPFPNVSTNVCYFMMEKSQKGETKVVDDNCSVTLNITHDFIFPSTFNEITVSIFNKVFNSPFEKFKFERDCKLHTQKKEIFSNDESEIFCYPVYCGSKIKFTSVLPNNIYLNKIVVSRSGYYKPIIDYGTNGTSESNFYIISNDVLLNFNILNHPIYKFIVKNTKFNGFIHQDILKSLPNPNTDDDLFGVFGLTNEEQKYIVNDVR